MSFAPSVLRTHARPVTVAIGLLSLLAVVAALPGSPLSVRAADHAVQIRGFAFGPSTMTVAAGDTVTWTNADSAPHTVTSEDGSFDSGNLDQGQTFSFTFTAPGTYLYRCDYHSDMTATIVVEAAASAQPNAPVAAAPTAAPAGGAQPNTALPAPDWDGAPVAPLLIGLGLLVIAFGVVPPRVRGVRTLRTGGWRR